MLMSEFIERTKFEPTAEEYAAIEQEYYKFSGDKDVFCKKWVRKGGIQRLSRERLKKIEELQKKISKMQKDYEELDRWADTREAHLCKLLNETRQKNRDLQDRLTVIRSITA